jgi:hypothetical protein
MRRGRQGISPVEGGSATNPPQTALCLRIGLRSSASFAEVAETKRGIDHYECHIRVAESR